MNRFLSKMVPSVIGIMLFTTNAWASPNLPRLNQSDLIYKGAFRVPKGNLGDGITFGYTHEYSYATGYNPTENTLLIVKKNRTFAEITIPTPVISATITELPTATLVSGHGAIDFTNNSWSYIGTGGAALQGQNTPGSLLYYGDKIIGTSWNTYDTGGLAALSHFTVSQNWVTEGNQFAGFYKVGTGRPNLVSGYMGLIPSAWQNDFGGPALTGQSCIAGIQFSSSGPAASVFDPALLGVVEPVPTTPVVQYTNAHQTLGSYGSNVPSMYYNMGSQVTGVVFPEGSSSVLFFGRQGLGSTGEGNGCYGPGTANMSQVTSAANVCAWFDANPTETVYACGSGGVPKSSCTTGGEPCCYDPSDASKGNHAYPYVYYAWAYDANDLLAVKQGHVVTQADYDSGRFVTGNVDTPVSDVLAVGQIVNAWNVKPYSMWEITLPIPNSQGKLKGAMYDPTTQQIYISQYRGEVYGTEPFPLIHVFQVNIPQTTNANAPRAPFYLRGTVVQ